MTGIAHIDSIRSAEDKVAERQLVIETLSGRCTCSSNPILQEMAWAIDSDNCNLEAEVLPGGKNKNSYKVHVNWRPEICVFVLLCLESAGDRYDNEFAIAAAARELAGDSVAAPIEMYDVERDGLQMKLVVTEWSARATQIVERSVHLCNAPGQSFVAGNPCNDIELNVVLDGQQPKACRSGVFQVASSSKRRRII